MNILTLVEQHVDDAAAHEAIPASHQRPLGQLHGRRIPGKYVHT